MLDTASVVKLHRAIARKYRNVGPRVIEMWRGFNRTQREKAMRESTGDGVVLKHSRDPSLGVLFHYISEYNLRDMTSGPDHFLDVLKLQATTDLAEQVVTSDAPHIIYMMKNHGMGLRSSGTPNEYMMFLDGDKYGRAFIPTDPTASFETAFPVLTRSGLCFPASTG